MDRRRIVRGIYAAAGAVLVCLALATCANPIDIVSAVTTQVKISNNKFLKVSDFAPAKNSIQVPPSSQIWIEFDRDLDPSTVNTSTVVLVGDTDPTPGWTADYTAATRTLWIRPTALQGPMHYTVSLKPGLLATDGSDLQSAMTWAFDTKAGPSGSLVINSNAAYATLASGTLTVNYQNATHVRWGTSVSNMTSAGWTLLTSSPQDISYGLGSDGTRTIYYEFMNATDHTDEVNPPNDSIILDTVAPSLSAMSINSADSSTTSIYVTLNWTASDATSGLSQMRFQNGSGGWGSWMAYSPSKAWRLVSTPGSRMVQMQVMDAATNLSSIVNDSIIYDSTTVTAATLNTTALGTVTATWNAATADSGTNSYYVYRRDYPSGGTYTYVGQTTGTSLNVAVPQGQLYFFHVTIYNAAAGEGVYSAAGPVGYTSNIAVIYNTNSTLASQIKSVLGTNWTGTYPVTGTMPTWSVTLIPQSLVSTTYAAGNVFYGDPLIVTPDTTLSGNANMTRNVTAHGHGVIAMGSGGGHMLDTVSANFASWGFSGTSPSEIGSLHSMGCGATIYAITVYNESVWTSPLSSTSVPANGVQAQMAYTTLDRIGVYRSAQTNPVNGFLYAQQNGYPYHYPVVRQDRFLQYGFEGLLDRPYTGWLFFVNLTSRMSSF